MKIEDFISRNSLRERLNGDFKLFAELAELFIKESPNLLDAVEKAVKTKNGEKIGKAAHTIKGAISNFSADTAYQAALNLESLGKNNELGMVDSAFKTLQNEVAHMNKALLMLMAENQL
jgi:two-component system, sensor histidine kinase and response regulator